MALQLGGLDFRVDGGEASRLSSNGTTVLLLHGVATTKDDGLSALQFAHGDLVQLGQKYRSEKPQGTEKLTENKEQEDAQRPLVMIATFLGSNNASAGGSKEKGWHSWPNF